MGSLKVSLGELGSLEVGLGEVGSPEVEAAQESLTQIPLRKVEALCSAVLLYEAD